MFLKFFYNKIKFKVKRNEMLIFVQSRSYPHALDSISILRVCMFRPELGAESPTRRKIKIRKKFIEMMIR